MFKYRFICANKDYVLTRINNIITNDLPCEKTLWGNDLYKSGIHFQESGDRIKGFYLAESENDSHRGMPIRVSFSGEFVKDDNNTFFDVYIYPNIFETLFFIFAFVFACVFGEVSGFIVAVFVLVFFANGYLGMMKDTYRILKEIFQS